MKILFVTDAWHPQINGVVRSLSITMAELEKMGHFVEVIGPDQFRTVPLPTYSEIKLAWFPGRKLGQIVDRIDPDAIHIATEGTLGWSARKYCLNRKLDFTTSYHTKFPEYTAERFPIPVSWSYAFLREFHAPSSAVMVATASVERELAARGFRNLRRWGRGVDTERFRPRPKTYFPDSLPRPVMLYVGRVAVEKSVEEFCQMNRPGTKVVTGDGPQLEELRAAYKDVVFTGAKTGDELAEIYASADVFVFPSRTDTFGLVLLEALASGLPVAAYPVPGPLDVIGDHPVGALDQDLAAAVARALTRSPEACRAFALDHGWGAATRQFLDNLRPFR